MLKKRGLFIGGCKPVKKFEKEIMDKVMTNYDLIQTPVRAFITFRTHEGYERCCKFMSNQKNAKKMTIFGQPVQFREATEPSNIIWENLEVTKATQKKRKVKVSIAILMFIVACFFLFVGLKATSGKNKQKYPVRVECDELVK